LSLCGRSVCGWAAESLRDDLLCSPRRVPHVAPMTPATRTRRAPPPDAAPTRLTLEAFLRLPERKPALEFDDEGVTRKVSPKGKHSRLQTDLAELFDRSGRRRKVARAFVELRFTFGGRSYVPDVSVYRWERIPRAPDGEVADDFLVPPDVAVEIVSPGQRVNTLVRRCLRYLSLGVQVALLIDPDDRSVIVFRPSVSAVAIRGPDAIDLSDLSDVLPGFRLTVEGLFRSLLMD
jgi:Uma2 family endonuclease